MSTQKATEKDKTTTIKPEEVGRQSIIEPCMVGRPLMLNCHAAIRGAELVPAKLIAILDYHLMNIQKSTGLLALTFRKDNRPSAKIGEAYPWAYAAAVNLQQVFDNVWAKLSKQDWGLNLRDAVWLGLIETVIHEITHIHMAWMDEEYFEAITVAGSDEDLKEDEDNCKTIAREFMLEMFKKIGCECPSIADMGFLGGLLQERFIKDKEHKYVIRSQQMLENEVAYEDKDKSTYYRTLRDYIRNNLVDKKDADEWTDDVNLVKVSFVMDDGEVIEAEAQPVVDAEEVLPSAEQEPIQVQATVGAAPAAVIPAMPMADGSDVEEDSNPDQAAVEAALSNAATQMGAKVGEAVAAAAATAPVVAPSTGASVPSAEVADTPEAQLAAKFNSAPQAAPDNLPQLNIPDENISACMQEVYMRLHSNIFLKAGWSLNQQTGRWQFAEPYNMTASVSVGDILTKYGCEGLIHEYVSFAEGQEVKAGDKADRRYACSGHIQGFVFTNKALPAYELILNIKGERVTRRIVPQNPNKVWNNAYTKGADFAGVGGNRVSYVFKGEAPDGVPFNQRCSIKITNEQIQVMS